jgi:hypothetical protein
VLLKVVDPANDGQPDDALQSTLNFIVGSPRLGKALEAAEIKGVQYLPVDVRDSSDNCVLGFSIFNLIERRSALDRVRSDFEVFPPDYFLPERRGRVRAIRRPVLVGAALRDTDMLRLDEFWFSEFVSERFVDVFKRNSFTGLGFVPVEVS